jgi:hypothetical protein
VIAVNVEITAAAAPRAAIRFMATSILLPRVTRQPSIILCPRLVALIALVFCFVAGYFVADLWSRRDTSPLALICARVDYLNGLQENLKDAASEEVRTELKALLEQCRTALRDRAEEND